MKYDLMLIGPATRDVNIDYTGKEVHEIGGAVFFCSAAAKAAGANLFASVKIHPDDTDIIDAFKLDSDHVAILPSETTTLMQNTYFTADRERRKAECLAQSGPITPDQIPEVDCGLYHLAGLLYGDFPNELIVELKKRGKVSADIQGFLRHNEGGLMNFHDWSDKLEYLKYFDFLKTDAAEAEILTGLTISPVFASGNLVVKETVPEESLTEGLSWVSTAGTMGASFGSMITGIVLDHFDPGAGLSLPAAYHS